MDLQWGYNNVRIKEGDKINTGKVAAFIDNVIVGMDTEKEHDEIVAEIIRKLEENDLYVKPEKCK